MLFSPRLLPSVFSRTPAQWVMPCLQWAAGVKKCATSPLQLKSGFSAPLWITVRCCAALLDLRLPVVCCCSETGHCAAAATLETALPLGPLDRRRGTAPTATRYLQRASQQRNRLSHCPSPLQILLWPLATLETALVGIVYSR